MTIEPNPTVDTSHSASPDGAGRSDAVQDEATLDAVVSEEVLVEGVSIDGMCGVY